MNMEKKEEAAKAPKRTAKKATAKKTAKTTETASPAVLKPEQKVLIMACLNPAVAKAATEAAHANNCEVVIMEDKVIHDYIASQVEGKKDDVIAKFLEDKKNRQFAEQNALKLYAILTGETNPSNADDHTFTEDEVVHKTTLSHSKARNLFDMLRAFGMLEFVGKRQFKLRFTNETRINAIMNEVKGVAGIVKSDIARLKAVIDTTEGITPEQKEHWQSELKTIIASVE